MRRAIAFALHPSSSIFIPSPACEGGWRAVSAFTRVFDALWRAGWGVVSIMGDPTRPLTLFAVTLPFQGRDNLPFAGLLCLLCK